MSISFILTNKCFTKRAYFPEGLLSREGLLFSIYGTSNPPANSWGSDPGTPPGPYRVVGYRISFEYFSKCQVRAMPEKEASQCLARWLSVENLSLILISILRFSSKSIDHISNVFCLFHMDARDVKWIQIRLSNYNKSSGIKFAIFSLCSPNFICISRWTCNLFSSNFGIF